MDTPAKTYRQLPGQAEPVPDALRDALLAGSADATPPGVPKPQRHRSGRKVPQVSGGNLTSRQKAVLCQIARRAWDIQAEHGLLDPGADFATWRRDEQLAAIGISSLRQARQSHYLHLRGHFEALAGLREPSTLARLTAPADDPDRQTVAQALRRELGRFAALLDDRGKPMGEHRAVDYLLAIARDRASGPPPKDVQTIRDTWPPKKIWTLVYTLRNRIAAKIKSAASRS